MAGASPAGSQAEWTQCSVAVPARTLSLPFCVTISYMLQKNGFVVIAHMSSASAVVLPSRFEINYCNGENGGASCVTEWKRHKDSVDFK